LTLFTFGLSKPNLDCTGTIRSPLPNLKFYLLTFPKEIIVHPLKLTVVEEEVFSFLCRDKPKSPVVCN